MKRLYSLIAIVSAVALMHGCGSLSIPDAVEVLSKSYEAMAEGNSQLAASCWSQGDYPKWLKEAREEAKTIEISIIRSEKKDGYGRLFVRCETDSSSFEKWFYFIRENGRTVLVHRVKALTMDWPTLESPHFIVHSRDLTKDEKNLEILEESYKTITDALGIEADGKIDILLFDSDEEYVEIVGKEHTGGLAFGRIVIDWKTSRAFMDGHEMTHSIFYSLGLAIPFLREGVATYADFYLFDRKYKDHSLEYWVNEYISTGSYVPIPDLLPWSGFRGFPDEISYCEAATFVAFLIEEKGGVERFRELYANSSTEMEFVEMVKTLYGKDINQMEEEWKEHIVRQQAHSKSLGSGSSQESTPEG